MQTNISDIVFVGDEEKDMVCARNAGAYAVLINRDDVIKNYGQDRTIQYILYRNCCRYSQSQYRSQVIVLVEKWN